VKRCGVLRRFPQETKLCKKVCLDPMNLGLASLRAQTRAAVSGIAELGRKDVERGLSRTLARTSLLRNFGRTGPRKDLLSLLRPRTRAAYSRRRRRATLSSLGDSALRGERGKLLVLLQSLLLSPTYVFPPSVSACVFPFSGFDSLSPHVPFLFFFFFLESVLICNTRNHIT
jgi:hypothetical protein